MKRADLIQLNPIPAVVTAAAVRELRDRPESEATRQFVSGYLGLDAHSSHALSETLGSLSVQGTGGAFWLNGVFGCGKSHLLGLLALLSEGAAHPDFLANHPNLEPQVASLPARLVVHFSLDSYDAGTWSLESIFWRELKAEWRWRGWGELELATAGSRAETFVALEEALRRQGLHGLVVCIDELSLFLAGRQHGALQVDAAFLQFVGQHSRRSPLWIFAALQKTVEDIGGLEAYSLAQIRDRYTLLPLAQANLAAIVQRRLVHPQDERRLEEFCTAEFAAMERLFPRQEFGARDWSALYPFHPATLAVLEAVTGRFFSRTRSAMLFCSTAAAADAPAAERVPVDAVFDYFEPELEGHPDLRPLAGVWAAWREAAPAIAGREADAAPLLRVMKAVLLWKMAGLAVTPLQLANALLLDGGLGGEGNYDYLRHLLERLRTQGSYLVVSSAEDPLLDRYSVDLGQRVAELARRHVQAAVQTLAAQDARISAHVLSCCVGEALPLAELGAPLAYTVHWKNAPRRLMVEVWLGGSLASLANRALATREPGVSEDGLLVIVPPFGGSGPDRDALEVQLEGEARAALWLWRPRAPLRDEWELAREATASGLLEGDPVLEDNRRGRAVLEYLRKEAPARSGRLARLALRLLREGEIQNLAGASVDAGELLRGENFAALLESLADFGWGQLFPRFESIAPRARLLTPSNADALCLEVLRRPPTDPYFSAAVDRLARHIGEPLGVAKPVAGRWQIASGQPALVAEVLERLGAGAGLAVLEAQLAKTEWGLRPEQWSLLLCALLRSGEVAALDGRGHELIPAQLGLPLRRSLHSLGRGRLVEPDVWARAGQVLAALCGLQAGTLSFAGQEKARLAWLDWKERTTADANLARARVTQLRRQLGHAENQWPQWEAACRTVADLVEPDDGELPPTALLTRLAAIDGEAVAEQYAQFTRVGRLLDERLSALLRGHALLTHPRLMATGPLAEQRAALVLRCAEGEAILGDGDLLNELNAFGVEYREAYRTWHRAQHNPDRWKSLRRLAASDELIALERLGTLVNRPLHGAARVREALQEETGKACPRDGYLEAGEAICASCQLAPGERVKLRDAAALQAEGAADFAALRQILAEPQVQAVLQRHDNLLLNWDSEPCSLLELLTPESLRQLDEALRPRRTVSRSLGDLKNQLKAAHTKAEWRHALHNWLDGTDHLAEDDELELGD